MEMPSWAKWAVSFLVAAGVIWIGWRVSAVLVALHILVCFVLVVVIMLQSGNAADLAGAFGGSGSQTAFGPRGAATFLSRATTWCAIVFMATSLALSFKRATPSTSTGSILEQTQGSGAPAAPPRSPVPPQSAPAPSQQGPAKK
jgi:preprotein translocase subunit SecG